MANINNYAMLFKTMAQDICLNKDKKIMFANIDGYSFISEYDSEFEDIKYSDSIYWNINIPTSKYKRVYFIDSNKSYLSGSYRLADGIMAYVLCIDIKILFMHSLKRKSLSEFLNAYRTAIADIIVPDEYISIRNRTIFALYAAMQILYDNFEPTKEILKAMENEDNFKTGVKDDNTIFENFYTLCNRITDINEAKVIRAFTEGINNVEFNNLFKTRRVPEVQETSD